MTDLTRFRGGNLSVANIREQLSKNLQETPRSNTGSGKNYLRFDPDEKWWVYGKSKTEVDPDSRFVVAPASIVHGYQAWHQKRPEWEATIPANADLSTITIPHLKAEKGAEYVRGFTCAGISGPEKGLTFEFLSNTDGGKKFVERLMQDIIDNEDEEYFYPILQLTEDNYEHKTHGLIGKPDYELVDWMTEEQAMGTDEPSADEPEPEPEPEEAPRRRRTTRR